jgi:hypothetical protein
MTLHGLAHDEDGERDEQDGYLAAWLVVGVGFSRLIAVRATEPAKAGPHNKNT